MSFFFNENILENRDILNVKFYFKDNNYQNFRYPYIC